MIVTQLTRILIYSLSFLPCRQITNDCHTADMDTRYTSYPADKIQMIVTQLTRILVSLLTLQTKYK